MLRDDPFAEILRQAESLNQEGHAGHTGHPFDQMIRRGGARQAEVGFLEILQQAPLYQGETIAATVSQRGTAKRKPHQPDSPTAHSPPVPHKQAATAPPQPVPVPVPVPQPAAAKPPRPVKPTKRVPVVRPEPVKMQHPEPKIEKVPEQGRPISRQELFNEQRELTPEQQELIRQLDEFEYDSE